MNPENNSELPPVQHGGPETQAPVDQQTPTYEYGGERQGAQAVEHGVPSAHVPQPQQVAMSHIPPAHADPAAAATPQIADDVDLIEKEWVQKAKAIVEQTKHDPRTQSIQINHVKADYLKRRFNKDLKVEG